MAQVDYNALPDDEFRAMVRGFIEQNYPEELRFLPRRVRMDEIRPWWNALVEKGWIAPNWPRELGGMALDPGKMVIYLEEMERHGVMRAADQGITQVGPILMKYGTEAQKTYYLPRTASGEIIWAQGYSEPGAGSDLASLKTRAERQGDHYIVNGQKTWNTLGQYADWIFCLVRTDPNAPKQQQGISFLLIDMKSPGITVRPIITMEGAHEVNEVWLENVKVPVENRIGEENKGWTYAKFLLGHERTNIAGVGASKRELQRLKDIARQETKNGRPLIEDPLFAARIAQVEIDLMALEMTSLRVLSAEAQKRTPGPEASILKIKGTEVQQALSELMMYAVGPYALPFERGSREEGDLRSIAGPAYAAPLAATYCNYRKVSIYGGSNEIQRNIISQMILGL
jgi:alkylation response protein AidB-like acyl-CoA dehydrogenase